MNPVRRRGFSLIELIIACLIIGLLAAIAVPRLGRSATTASDSALAADLALLRTALDNYSSEHKGNFPSYANLVGALTRYTDAAGNVSATRTGSAPYGPYIAAIPMLPVSSNKGATGIAAPVTPDRSSSKYGWIYDESTGTICANSKDETDATGKLYSSY